MGTPINLSAGNHIVYKYITDWAGRKTTSHKFFTLHDPESYNPIPPKIDPLPNPVNETSITVEGNAYSGFNVEVYRNNELMGTVNADERGRFRLEGVSLVPGTNAIRVRQKEGIADLGSKNLTLTAADSSEIVVEVISGTPSRPAVKIDFPVDGAVTDAEVLPLRGTISDPNAVLRLNGYYNSSGYAQNQGGRFVSNQLIPLLPGKNTLWIEATAPDRSRGVDKIIVYSKRRDAQVPSVNITSPAANEEVYYQYISTSGTMADSAQKIIVNESEATLNSGAFESSIDIFSSYVYNPYGYERMITAWAMDANGNIGHHDIPFRYKYIPVPQLYISSPMNGEILSSSPITVTGSVYDASEVMVNGISAIIDSNIFTATLDLKEGQNTITVIAKNTVKASARTIYVTYQPGTAITLQSIAIEPSPATVAMGNTRQLRAIGTYSDGQKTELTNTCQWQSNSPDIATVNINSGLVKGIYLYEFKNSANITALCSGLTGTSTVYVTPPILKTITIAHEKTTDAGIIYTTENPDMTINQTLNLKAFGTYSDGSYKDMGARVTWTSSNPAIAAINSAGVITAISKGTTQITTTDQNTFIIATTSVTINPAPVYIFITSPADNSATDKTEVTITGTVITQALEVGITINGKIATVYGNQFTANKVPLTEGSNVITAMVIDSNGATAEAKMTITALPQTNYIKLTSNIESGTGPLEATLRIDGSFSITQSSLSYSGGTPELIPVSAEEWKVKLTTEGIYYFTAKVTGPDGNLYHDTIAITVLNKTEIDNLLKAKWEGMKGALVAGGCSQSLE